MATLRYRKAMVLPRILVTVDAGFDLAALCAYMQQPEEHRFFVVFHVLRILLFFAGSLIFYLTFSGYTYIPGISEMRPLSFWLSCSYFYVVPKLIFMNRFVTVSPLVQFVLNYLSVVIVGVLLIAYQSHWWIAPHRRELESRLRHLLKKGRISSAELEAIRQTLATLGARRNRPFVAKALLWTGSILLGAILSAQAQQIVRMASLQVPTLGRILRNLFPPY
jgi:hypothetical protein